VIALFLALSALFPTMALTEAEYQAILAKRHPETMKITTPKKAKRLRQDDRRPNATESRYAFDILRVTEGVESYEYEAVTFKLGNGLKYTPDYMVVKTKGSAEWIEFHEVKGEKVWEDSIVKLKATAAKYPYFKFVMAQWVDKQWVIQEVLP
jgi:hypothetical protein